MSLVDTCRDNAADCAFLAERAEDEETKHAFLRMEAAWRTLAIGKSDWTLKDGKGLPVKAPVSVRNAIFPASPIT
jgi:hypothetical protein